MVNWFSSRSSRPILDLGAELFIVARHSVPVYTTTPTAVPEATTVLAHMVFSMLSGSSRLCWTLWKLALPMKLWMSFCGFSAKTDASRDSRSSSAANFWVSGTAIRSFQSVSPSSWSVRMKQDPDDSVVRSRTMSAGTRQPLST